MTHSTEEQGTGGRRWLCPLVARDASETHRQATPLELFFDLCFVVAVAIAAEELHHAVLEGHAGEGAVRFLLVFFAVWWAWMNFTWFASAYDNDDVFYRLATFVQMTGVLILAAGLHRIAAGNDFTVAVAGYIVMRLALVPQWLRAAHDDPPRRTTALRYAGGIVLVQAAWILRLALPEPVGLATYLILAAFELAIPAWAESAEPTTWHPSHIGERYGLFTLIVLGETVLSSTLAIESALTAGHDELDLALLAAAGLVTVFSMWWLYFGNDTESEGHGPVQRTSFRSFVWGYGHAPLFASIAATGAGIAVAVDSVADHEGLSAVTVSLAVAVPIAVYLTSLWAIRVLKGLARPVEVALPAGAIVALLLGFAGLPVHAVALDVAAVAVVVSVWPGTPTPG